jgi:hypothetical protein
MAGTMRKAQMPRNGPGFTAFMQSRAKDRVMTGHNVPVMFF